MKITSIRINNFRAIQSSHVYLNQLTACVGKNSSGKSTLLRALNCFLIMKMKNNPLIKGVTNIAKRQHQQ